MSRLFKERQTVTSPNANSTGERRRIIYMILIFIVVSVGLGSRYYSNQLPGWVELYVGDTLWAFNVFLMLGFLFSRKTSLWVAVVAFSFSLLIEISQLYHAAWIDGIRAYKIGGVVLGFGFLWSDLICYLVGISFGLLFENSKIANRFFFKSK